MAMRLQELHPSLVHYPIALLPLSLAADALGRATGSAFLLEVGKRGMALAAGTAAVSAVAGLIAQETVRTDEESHRLLVTHRTLNVGLVGLTAALALKRAGRRRPSVEYLAAGAMGVGAMGYSAYLGGKMVYTHGVGVEKAGGVLEENAPELHLGNAGEVARLSGRHIQQGLAHVLEDARGGELVPALTHGSPAEAGAGDARGVPPGTAGAPPSFTH